MYGIAAGASIHETGSTAILPQASSLHYFSTTIVPGNSIRLEPDA